MRGDDWVLIAGAGILLCAIAYVVHAWSDREDWKLKCETKGGIPYCARRSECVCLKPGTVIE